MGKKKGHFDGLTGKQKLFAEYYVANGFNATQAALDAGYAKKAAYYTGFDNLRKPKIEQYIKKIIRKQLGDVEKMQAQWLNEIKSLAFSDVREIADWNNKSVKLKPSDDITDNAARAISEVSCTENDKSSNVKVKMHNKERALELMGRFLNILTEHHIIEQEDEVKRLTRSERRRRIVELLNKKKELEK